MDSELIFSWNCRGLPLHFEEVKLLLIKYNPTVFCLQETNILEPERDKNGKLKDESPYLIFNGYKGYHSYATSENNRAHGGASIWVKDGIPHKPLEVETTLQVVSIAIHGQRCQIVSSVYLSPATTVSVRDLNNLINQFSSPYILNGDFNARSEALGDNDYNQRGPILQNFILDNNICIMNTGEPTRIDPNTGNGTVLDLALCHPELVMDYEFQVADDLSGSDHFPIILKAINTQPLEPIEIWNFEKADWSKFSESCIEQLTLIKVLKRSDGVDLMQAFIDNLFNISKESIPRYKSKPKKSYPWFNDEIRQSIRARKQAQRRFHRQPNLTNKIRYKELCAHTRRTIRQAKKKSWADYISKLNAYTPVKKTWDMVRKISGKVKSQPVTFIKTPKGDITSKEDIAKKIGETVEKNSSSQHYSEKFQKVKENVERKPINFGKSDDKYNKKFTESELYEALRKSKDSATGVNPIHYQILKHLPPETITVLCHLFNHYWLNDTFPDCWKEAVIIPIPKPGKDASDPENLRPIALTCCLCKTMERMVNSRLVNYLERHNILSKYQSGYRKGRSTADQLVRLETKIREAFLQRKHMVGIFFDLEKAFDTAWKHGILKDLFDAGLRGTLPCFIKNFLSDRSFKIRLGSVLTGSFMQENGVPQGSILSPVLFLLKINSVMKCLENTYGSNGSLFVDDLSLGLSGQTLEGVERRLQAVLRTLQTWCDENGFKFSPSKTICVHFTRKHNIVREPELFLNGVRIPVRTEAKFLGVWFDRKLTFKYHIDYLREKCTKALNLLKTVAHRNWGGDRTVLLRLYRSLIRSKLDYGSIVYGSAAPSHLKKLDVIAHSGLRIALGAFRTSPIESLYAEAGEPPLSLRRGMLSTQYAIRVAQYPKNPVYDDIFNFDFLQEYLNKPPSYKGPFGFRVMPLLEEINFNKDIVFPCKPISSPWAWPRPEVDWSLSEFKKSETSSEIYLSKFAEVKASYADYRHIYTDGSKTDEAVAFAAYYSNLDFYHNGRLNPVSSVYTAEIFAIIQAFYIIHASDFTKFVIFSDSKSSLQTLSQSDPINPFVCGLFKEYVKTLKAKKEVKFCWVPSHSGLPGNEKVDALAKEALTLDNVDMDIQYVVASDYNQTVRQHLKKKHQTSFDESVHNKLRQIQPSINYNSKIGVYSRKDEMVVTRLKIGHTYLTNGYLLRGEDPPYCHADECDITVKHILTECWGFEEQRRRFLNAPNYSDLFKRENLAKLIEFCKQSEIYNLI